MNLREPMTMTTLLVGAALTSVSWLVLGSAFGLGTLAGSLFALANVVAFQFVVGMMFEGRSGGALLSLKLLVNFAVVYVLCRVLGLEPRGVALGYSALVVGTLVGAYVSAIPTTRSGEA